MDPETLKLIIVGLTGGGVGMIVVAIIKLRENRTTLRYGYEVAEAQRNARWNAAYRRAAEKHLPWDQTMRNVNFQLQEAVHRLEHTFGQPETPFDVIPEAPPLFPDDPEV